MAKKKASQKGKGHYATYQASNQYSVNKKAKLERHLKKFPNDETAKACLEKYPFQYNRKKPNTREWRSVVEFRGDDKIHMGHETAIRFAQQKSKIRKFWNIMKYEKYENYFSRLYPDVVHKGYSG